MFNFYFVLAVVQISALVATHAPTFVPISLSPLLLSQPQQEYRDQTTQCPAQNNFMLMMKGFIKSDLLAIRFRIFKCLLKFTWTLIKVTN